MDGAQNLAVFCDIKKKHSAHAVTSDVDIVETAEAAKFFLADGVIVTGTSTGQEADVGDLERVVDAAKDDMAVLVGSGVTEANIGCYSRAHGLIVGSYFKRDGRWQNDLEPRRIEGLLQAAAKLRAQEET